MQSVLMLSFMPFVVELLLLHNLICLSIQRLYRINKTLIWILSPSTHTFATEIKKVKKGTITVPFSIFYNLTIMESPVEQIQNLLNDILADEAEIFCVNLKIKPTNNIKIFLDGDNGITIEKCVQVNRKLYKALEEMGLYPEGDFSLEISSPGIDEPLKLIRQYKKNVGRFLEIVFNDDSVKEGKLVTATDTDIIIETTEGKGKKAITQQVLIPLENIKKATVQVKF